MCARFPGHYACPITICRYKHFILTIHCSLVKLVILQNKSNGRFVSAKTVERNFKINRFSYTAWSYNLQCKMKIIYLVLVRCTAIIQANMSSNIYPNPLDLMTSVFVTQAIHLAHTLHITHTHTHTLHITYTHVHMHTFIKPYTFIAHC